MSNKFRRVQYVHDVPCSVCGTPAGVMCRNSNGSRRQIGPHRARMEAHRIACEQQALAETATQEEVVMSNKFQTGEAFTISRQPATIYEIHPGLNVMIGAVTGTDGDRFGATWDCNSGQFVGPESDAGLDYEAPALNLRPNVVLSSAPKTMTVRGKQYKEAPEIASQDDRSGCIGCEFYKDYSCAEASREGAKVFSGDCAERNVIYVRADQ